MINDDPILSFGKYQGEPLSQVAEDNPAYLFWLINNANLSGSLQEQIKDHLSRIKFDPNAENRPFPICPQSGNGAVHARCSCQLPVGAKDTGSHRSRPQTNSTNASNVTHRQQMKSKPPSRKCTIKTHSSQARYRNQKRVKLDPRLRAKVIAENALTLEELRAASPTNYDDNPNASEEIVDALFGNDNSWICAGLSVHEFATRCRESWRGHLHRMAVIVPSPMRSKFGRAQGGYLSEHTLDNVGPRKFIVVDQDGVPITEQIPILRYLAQFLPLVLIVFSGNESVHGWFHVGGLAQEFVDKFFDHAEALGADHALRSPMQFARVPAGRHKNGNLQRVFFFDPDAINPTQLPAAIFPNSQPDVAPAASVSSLENDPDPPLQDQTNGKPLCHPRSQ